MPDPLSSASRNQRRANSRDAPVRQHRRILELCQTGSGIMPRMRLPGPTTQKSHPHPASRAQWGALPKLRPEVRLARLRGSPDRWLIGLILTPGPGHPAPDPPGPRTIRSQSAMRVHRASRPAVRGAARPDGREDDGRHSGAPGGPGAVIGDLLRGMSRRHTARPRSAMIVESPER
jgi:hypothetical protein